VPVMKTLGMIPVWLVLLPLLSGIANAQTGGSPDSGKKLFQTRCAQCHAIDPAGNNKVGPNLYGVIGCKSGTLSSFSYTDAMKAKDVTWTADTLFAFFENPKKYVPGTKMASAGLRKARDRNDLIAYMQKLPTSSNCSR